MWPLSLLLFESVVPQNKQLTFLFLGFLEQYLSCSFLTLTFLKGHLSQKVQCKSLGEGFVCASFRCLFSVSLVLYTLAHV